ncbi:MAG: insulinase family protein [Desulfohalobiaceae bacterium]|nr:insulinase family protein [Desulfohalobiaceae bacterium]
MISNRLKRAAVICLAAAVLIWVTAPQALSRAKHYSELTFEQPVQWPEPEVLTFSLDNGISFFLVEDHELPLVEVSVSVRAGEWLVPEGKEGLAEICAETMRNGGTENHPPEELNRLLANKAAVIETGFDFVSGSASMNVLSEDFREILPVFVELLSRPAFPMDKINLAKQQLKTEISRRNDSQDKIAYRVFKRLIYGRDTVYARIPEYETVDAVSRSDLVDFHDRAYQGQNLMVGIVGDFDPDEIRPLLNKEFSAFPKGRDNDIRLPAIEVRDEQSYHVVEKSDVNQSLIIMGHLGGWRQDPDYAELQVMNKILSGGFSGRLFERIRSRKGLAYSVFGRYDCHYYYPGLFFVGLKTGTASSARAVTAVRQELERLRQGVSREELDQAKDQFFNSLIFSYDEPEEILERRMYYAYRGMPADSFHRLTDEIRGVTVEDVVRVAGDYLNPDRLTVLAVGRKQELLEQLRELGRVEVIEP